MYNTPYTVYNTPYKVQGRDEDSLQVADAPRVHDAGNCTHTPPLADCTPPPLPQQVSVLHVRLRVHDAGPGSGFQRLNFKFQRVGV